MYSTRGHQLVVNEYHAECLRKAREKEREAARDAHHEHPSTARGRTNARPLVSSADHRTLAPLAQEVQVHHVHPLHVHTPA